MIWGIQTIIVKFIYLDENNTIYKILKRHKYLRNIIIEFKEINDTHIILLGENVLSLNINGCHKLTDKSLLHISTKCTNIKKLGKIN